jgi:hypothetical protein
MYVKFGAVSIHLTKAFIKRSPSAPRYWETRKDSYSIELFALGYYLLITTE